VGELLSHSWLQVNLMCRSRAAFAAQTGDVQESSSVCCSDRSLNAAHKHLQDVMMPDVDGIELLRFLRGNDAFAAVPVVSECLLGASCSMRALHMYCQRAVDTCTS
jgi:response regulator RpfG family c-di-GMP phosphodiesterase